jgi:hypothetical protein
VIEFYDDVPENPNVGRREVDPLARQLDDPDDEAGAIIAFLEALNDDSFDKTIPSTVAERADAGRTDSVDRMRELCSPSRVTRASMCCSIALALTMTACREPTQPTEAPDETSPALTIHDVLIDCAGAIAADGNVDPLVEPSTGTREENALWTVLALMDKEPGLLGAGGA